MKSRRTQAQPLGPFKKWIFVAITASLPLVFFAGIEFALRWADYGQDLSLFRTEVIRHQAYCLLNPGVEYRYFGTMRFAPSTSPDYFQTPKPAGTYRIFCLGGSTTVGYPYYFNGSFSSYLRDRLRMSLPRKNIEVINLGMTATNSFTVRDVARELMDWQPDMVIVYDGHNEFYGALGVASRQTAGSSRVLILAYLRLIHLRAVQLLRNVFQSVASWFGHADDGGNRGTMMEAVARDQYVTEGSSLYNAAYGAFRQNLEDLKRYCTAAGVPLLLATQVSNLRDQTPFISADTPGLTDAEKERFRRIEDAGSKFQAGGAIDSAVAAFQAGVAIDSFNAGAHYALAQGLDLQGRKHDALLEYISARDFDARRFRTDSKFNDLIRSMADQRNCYVVDVEEAFKSLSPDSLIGHNLIVEHLHPTARGSFEIARCFEAAMRRYGLLASQEEWKGADSVNEGALWECRTVTALDERVAAMNTAILVSGWPFTTFPAVPVSVPANDTLGRIAERVARSEWDWTRARRGGDCVLPEPCRLGSGRAGVQGPHQHDSPRSPALF